MQRILLSSLSLLLMIFTFNGTIAFAEENPTEQRDGEETSYFSIHYDGEEQEVILEDDTKLILTSWIDESKSAVRATLRSSEQTSTSNSTNELILEVTEHPIELKLPEDKSIYYTLHPSDLFIVEELNLSDSNIPTDIIENEVEVEDEVDNSEDETTTTDKRINKEEETDAESVDEQKPKIASDENENSTNTVAPTKDMTITSEAYSIQSEDPIISYSTHIQGIGWQSPVFNGETSGTSGKAKRLEGIKISIDNAKDLDVTYTTHVQGYGWLDYVSDGIVSGTTGKAKRLEAIKIELTGKKAQDYDVYYRVHAQTHGWLGWAKNGEPAGTEGLSKRLEAIEIKVIEKGSNDNISTGNSFIKKPTIVYSTHVQTYGWMNQVRNGALSGTTGKEKRLEAIKISLQDSNYSGDVVYSTHVQNLGWLDNVSNGGVSGTNGQSKRMEAIKINLTGGVAKYYDVYYRVHSQSFGWLGWAKNGQAAGTEGLSKRLEAIEIKLVAKGGKAPGSTADRFLTKPSIVYSSHVQTYGWLESVKDGAVSGTQGQSKRLEAIKIDLKNSPYSGNIVYSTHVQTYGWLNDVSNGAIAGTNGQSKRMEAIQINLTGEIAKHYDVYYRVHSQSYGWLGWAKNGMKAGSEGNSKRLEAIEIKLVPKGKGQSVKASEAFKQPVKIKVFLDPGHGGFDTGAVAGGVREADLNLTVAKKVEKLLKARGYSVHMSRNNDTYVGLYDRAQMANNLDADIFISVHHNSTAFATTIVNGIESYYYKYNKEYPSKINQDMHNNPERIKKSITLASLVHQNMHKKTGAVNRGIGGASFAVVRETKMPATLLELGYINNATERIKLVSDSYQNKLAEAIANGVDQYFNIY
ncbi:uncharacterized protein YjdB [Lederbergia galactosidilyticus]|uniref:N-acetylmuramoyl-L-alanine amidase n=1 Tax=Lederbergia galactosidilytica TaxID=217031 RepID=UPI001AE16F1D|nr:N-acetylmuramoyl-L-alanine amidase [Lederbergia galactosidilytica]MBP1915464.1 uncharacterized protein YjdB [Lederbergia galactosidilytica]